MYRNQIVVSIHDRYDPHQVVVHRPRPGVPMKDGYDKITRLEDIREAIVKGQHRRTDIALVSFWNAEGEMIRQESIHVTRLGIEWKDCEQYFTFAERKEMARLWKLLVKAAAENPEMGVYLGDRFEAKVVGNITTYVRK